MKTKKVSSSKELKASIESSKSAKVKFMVSSSKELKVNQDPGSIQFCVMVSSSKELKVVDRTFNDITPQLMVSSSKELKGNFLKFLTLISYRFILKGIESFRGFKDTL